MVISSTLFPHKNIHKGTWKASDGKIENQIDHVLINARLAKDIVYVRSHRMADCNSDHFLV
jgi:endonuclease/exonuclease/phosphatase family metal-dependent hydrolase